jgi:hypothetical protein
MIRALARYGFGVGEEGVGLLRQGWARPEARFTWSVGDESRIELLYLPRQGNLRVELTLEPFRDPPRVVRQTLRLEMDGAVIAELVMNGPGVVVANLPLPSVPRPVLVLRRVREAGALDAAAVGVDKRDLAFKLIGLTVLSVRGAPPPAAVRPMAEWRIGCNEKGITALAEGWSTPEFDFVWAVGRSATLRLDYSGQDAPPAGRALLVMEMRPVENPAGVTRQRVVVGADDRLVGYLDLTGGSTIALPVRLPEGGGAVEIRFDHPDAFAYPAVERREGQPLVWALSSARLVPALQAVEARTLAPLAPDGGDDPLRYRAAERATGLPIAELAGKFESLGNTCGLGNLQRHLGLMPLALLSFSRVFQTRLVDAVFRGFADFAREDRLRLAIRHPEDDVWGLVDDTYQFSFATPYPRTADPPPGAVARALQTLPWLAEKLMRDIAAAEKIFMLRVFSRDEAVALAVLAALRHYGNAAFVALVDDASVPAGTVRRCSSGVLLGSLGPERDMTPDESDAVFVSLIANAWMLIKLPGPG